MLKESFMIRINFKLELKARKSKKKSRYLLFKLLGQIFIILGLFKGIVLIQFLS
jgi:hypothetical protein